MHAVWVRFSVQFIWRMHTVNVRSLTVYRIYVQERDSKDPHDPGESRSGLRSGPKSVVDAGRSPKSVVDAGRSPKSVVDAGRSPKSVVDAGRSPKSVVDAGRGPKSVVDAGRGPKSVVDAGRSPKTSKSVLGTGRDPKRMAGAGRDKFWKDEMPRSPSQDKGQDVPTSPVARKAESGTDASTSSVASESTLPDHEHQLELNQSVNVSDLTCWSTKTCYSR